MGKSRVVVVNPNAKMIDTSTKQQGGMGVVEAGKKAQSYREPQRKHNAINLPKNLIESDSEEDYEEENSSEDDNDHFTQEGLLCDSTGQKVVGAHQVTCDFGNLTLNTKQNTINKLVQKLSSVAKKYKETQTYTIPDTENKHKAKPKPKYSLVGLKARSPYRNRLTEHKQTPFERQDLSVTTAYGTGGRVFVHSPSLTPIVPEPVANFPKDNIQDILEAIQDQDFIASFIDLSSDEAEQVFFEFGRDKESVEVCETEGRVSAQDLVVPDAMMSPATSLSPHNSPNNVDFYDSSYETGSPGSTVVTSPGSPSQPRTSVSSESDQELDPAMETLRSQPLPTSQTNIVIIPTTVLPKSEPKMRPLGEVVNYVVTSASQRLYDLSKSTSFTTKHFTIQLVRVVMTTKADNSSDRIQGFAKSLMNTMKTRILNKPHEGDIWQLSIYAHIQFLTAPDRMVEYRSTLKTRDEHGYPLLYIATIKHFEKPHALIARYIAESMSQVGYSPMEPMDDAGNTILHLVAEQGDSHRHVLGELLMAMGPNNRPLLSVHVPNSAGQTPLHVAARSPRPQVSTLISLLKFGARPFDLDHCQMTALHYYIQGMSNRTGCRLEELGVIRKMIQAPMSLNRDSLQILERLRADSSIPSDIANVIGEEIERNCSKDFRPKKIERR